MALTKATTKQITHKLPSGVVRNVYDKLGEVVSVKDFGAVGNGIVDDTAAIQAAINALGANGGEVIFPFGNYKVSAQINIPLAAWTPVSLRGAAGTQITSTHNGIVINDSTQNVRLEGLWFIGPGKTNSSAVGFNGSLTMGYVKGCRFQGFWYGIQSDGSIGCLIEKTHFTNNHVGYNNAATSPAFGNLLNFASNWFDFNDYGMYLRNLYGVALTSNVFEYNGTGVDAQGVREITARNNWFELNGTTAYSFTNYCNGILEKNHLVANGRVIDYSTSPFLDRDTPLISIVQNSATQSIPHNSQESIQWNTRIVDNENMHAGSGFAWVIRVPATGYYNVTLNTQLAAFASPGLGSIVRTTVQKNGVDFRADTRIPATGQVTQSGISFVEKFNAGDFIAGTIYQNSGGALNLLAGGLSGMSVSLVSF